MQESSSSPHPLAVQTLLAGVQQQRSHPLPAPVGVHANGINPTHIAAQVRLARGKSNHLAVTNHLQAHLPRQGQHTNQFQQRPGVFFKDNIFQFAQIIQVAPVGRHNLKGKHIAHGCES